MQQYSRTIFTTDAYQIKKNSIKQEYGYKVAAVEKEIQNTSNNIESLRKFSLKPGYFLNLTRKIFFILATLQTIIALTMTSMSQSSIIVAVFLWTIYTAIFMRCSQKINVDDIRIKEIERLLTFVDSLEEKKMGIVTEYSEVVDTLDEEYRTHMKNQIDILENEIENDLILDTTVKECPRCAEKIKKKAKVCRFCNFDLI